MLRSFWRVNYLQNANDTEGVDTYERDHLVDTTGFQAIFPNTMKHIQEKYKAKMKYFSALAASF